MGDTVFVNGRSVFHKGSSGKSLAAFPDPCLCPPPPPAGPVPTPLPNNAMASDITGGASSVLVEGNPAGHKKAYISKSTGNEAADPKASGQGGLVTHVVQGAAHFQSASMDVFFEGVEAVRHLDILTHNHANPGNTPPHPMAAVAAFAETGSANCGPGCDLSTYKPNKCPSDPKTGKKKTPHHIVPKHCFKELRNAADGSAVALKGWGSYKPDKAPCICVTGSDKAAVGPGGGILQHGRIHARVDLAEAVASVKNKGTWTFAEANSAGTASTKEVVQKCDEACVKAVVEAAHGSPPPSKKLRAHCPKSEKSALRAAAMREVTPAFAG